MDLNEQLASLNANFGLPGVLAFEAHPGTEMIRAQITLPSAAATLYLHGAHLTHWQPAGQQPVLFLSERSAFAPDKAIRGGIPVCWPWFGPRGDGLPGPSHGFARTSAWEIAFAALVPGSADAGDELHLTLTLGPSEQSRSLGFADFRVACEFRIGTALEVRLSAANTGTEPLRFEEALHSYFHVGDVRQTALTGLESARFLDKTDRDATGAMREKTGPATPLRLTAETDRVYPGHTGDVIIHDEVLGRTIRVVRANSQTVVVWNPWAELAKTMADLEAEAWPGFVCVEAANTGADAVTLAPSAAHTMTLTVSLS